MNFDLNFDLAKVVKCVCGVEEYHKPNMNGIKVKPRLAGKFKNYSKIILITYLMKLFQFEEN